MNATKRIALYACEALIVAILAMIVDALAVSGSPAYAVSYPAARLCNSLQPGMELTDAEARMYQLGRPEWAEYRGGQLAVGSRGTACIVDTDPTTNRIVKVTISGWGGAI